jgi:trimethylamine--corrinoid protein Co-methyltransferase
MLYMVAGGEEKWLERPFVSNSNCFVVPPMKFAEESCITMEDCIRRGMPMLLLSARAGRGDRARADRADHRAGRGRMSGGRGLCQRDQTWRPGDLWHLALRFRPAHRRDVGRQRRTGAFDRRLRPDAPLLRPAGRGRLGHQSDSKLPDMQAGWEQGITNALAGLAGLNMCYEAVGMHASLLGLLP